MRKTQKYDHQNTTWITYKYRSERFKKQAFKFLFLTSIDQEDFITGIHIYSNAC